MSHEDESERRFESGSTHKGGEEQGDEEEQEEGEECWWDKGRGGGVRGRQ